MFTAERAKKTMVHIGPAVFSGGFSTFLAFLLLVNSISYGFTLFFRVTHDRLTIVMLIWLYLAFKALQSFLRLLLEIMNIHEFHSDVSRYKTACIFIGYYTAMVCQGPVLAHLRQYWPKGFSPRANASEGVPIRARGIP